MMMPSRGVLSAAGGARQAIKTNRRFISTTPIRTFQSPLAQSRGSLLYPNTNTSSWRSSRIAGASIISLAAHSRLASTSTSTPATGHDAAAATATSSQGPLDNAAAEATSSFDISGVTDTYLTGIPEQIGYLKEIGLDYGWGPTAMIEYALEHIHVYSGMPWWGSIMVTAVAFRLAMFPLFRKSSDIGARTAAMQPITKPISDRMMAFLKANDMENMAKARAELNAVQARAGISMSAMMTPAIIQGVFGFCAFKLMRAMANLPVPGLETGGFLWFTDLTQRDPYLALPAIMALSMHVVFRMGGESGAPMANPAMRPLMLYFLPGLIFVSTLWMPANLDLWLATTGLVGIAQVTAFKQPGVRKALNMAPLTPNDPRSSAPAKPKTIDVKAKSRPADQQQYMRYQAPNLKTNAVTPDELKEVKQDFLTRTKEGMFDKINSMGEAMTALKEDSLEKAANLARKKGVKESKTRSKDFIKQAEAYEARWQRANGKKDGQ